MTIALKIKLRTIVGITLAIISFVQIKAQAQLKFPEIKPHQIGKKNAVSAYIPKGVFATTFPNFLNDGKYYFDVRYPEFDSQYEMPFTFKEYPATITESNAKANELQNTVIYLFDFSHQDMSIYVSGEIKNFSIVHPEEYKSGFTNQQWKDISDRYAEANNFFKTATNNVLTSKGFSNNKALYYQSRDVKNNINQNTDVVFDITINGCGLINDANKYLDAFSKWGSGISHQQFKKIESNIQDKSFPEYILYTLTVRNKFGEAMASYNQTIFMDIKDRGYKAWWCETIETMRECSFEIAFKSLINKFLNDTPTVNALVTQNKQWAELIKNNHELSTVFSQKIKYGALQQYKPELAFWCQMSKVYFEGVKNRAAYDKNSMSAYVSSARTDVYAQAGNAVGNAMNATFERSAEKSSQRKFDLVTKEVSEYNKEIATIIATLQELAPSREKDELLAQMAANEDNQFAGLIEEAKSAQATAAQATAANYAAATEAFKQLSNRLNTQVSSAAVTADNSRGVTSYSNDQCQAKANSEWKTSSEFSNYMNNKTNANYKDCEAKLIELTLKYCGSKLSPSEYAADDKAAKQAREDANALRSGSTPIKL